MRIGLTGGGRDTDAVIRQAQQAEADGFASLWFPGAVLGDPLAAIALAGRETSTIEFGTAVMQSYTCHPVLQANRFASVAAAIGTAGRLTLGVGPSHEPAMQPIGFDYATPGRHTDEYVQIVAALLRGESVDVSGEEYTVAAGPPALIDGQAIPVLVSALGPRLLRVAGQHGDGTILWMANAKAVADHVAPRLAAAATEAGRPAPRIVAGLPVAVHDDVAEARETAAREFVVYGTLPNYQRILAHGGISSPGDAAIVGDEASVAEQINALFEAGATDFWAAPMVVGDDRSASRARTRALLQELAAS
jgi:F420-dependent oxidoreductase-like protein